MRSFTIFLRILLFHFRQLRKTLDKRPFERLSLQLSKLVSRYFKVTMSLIAKPKSESEKLARCFGTIPIIPKIRMFKIFTPNFQCHKFNRSTLYSRNRCNFSGLHSTCSCRFAFTNNCANSYFPMPPHQCFVSLPVAKVTITRIGLN